MNKRIILKLTIILISVFLTKCSAIKPQPTERKGLFNIWAEYEPVIVLRDVLPDAKDIKSIKDYEVLRIVRKWQWPLKNITITSHYGEIRNKGRIHKGIDLRAKKGTKVFSVSDGKVLFSGNYKGYGKMIIIKHENSMFSLYAHLSKLSAKKGQLINKGDVIAKSGNTGHSRGDHLHFEIINGNKSINPLDYMKPHKITTNQKESRI